jgi:acyl dehydratase
MRWRSAISSKALASKIREREVGFDLSRVGWSRDSEEFRVNTARIAAFARSINDENPEHLTGRLAPPVFAHVPVMQSMVEVLESITPDFPVHGEHDFHLLQPVEPGQRLFSRSTCQGILQTGAGVAIVIKSETNTEAGNPVTAQYTTAFVHKAKIDKSKGEAGPRKPAGEHRGQPLAEVTHKVDPDQTWRYADAARDYSPYALDARSAQAKGFPAPIMHGMCTISFAGRAIVDGALEGKSRQLKRLGGRFSHPVFMVPGQRLLTRLWQGPALDSRRTILFETADSEGHTVIKNGFAEVLP